MLQLTIDGIVRSAEPGRLLDVLLQGGVEVPHLCHDPRLTPHGGCRLCLVEVDGEPRPVASCACQAEDGMVVRTDTPALRALRRTHLQLLAESYPPAAMEAEPQHPLHRLFAAYDVEPGGQLRDGLFLDDTHPYIGIDMTRCIDCQRCVRICEQLQGQFVWEAWQRGAALRIAPAHGATLLEGGCVSCGACVDSCPSGALYDKRVTVEVEGWTRTTCVYCAVGCQMEVGRRGGRVVAVRPAASPVNRGHLCVKGRYAFEFNHSPERITWPMIRNGEGWRRVSWDEALDFTAAKLRAIIAAHGADAIGVLGSARATNEENYLAQKFARVVLGTNNVDCCARVCHTPSAKALKTMLGTGAASNGFDDIELAGAFLICGANPTENHPVVGARIKQAVLNGARLVVIDPRRTELAGLADVHLAPRPGCNVPLFNAMAATLIEEDLLDQAFIGERVDGFDAFADFIVDYAPERVAMECGVSAADIRAAARLYAAGRPSMCLHGLGVTEHLQGTEGVMTLINLALLTGNLGRPGAGINPLRGQNNVQGAAHMGCDPATLPGGHSFKEAGARCASAWGAPLPERHGRNLLQMVDAAAAGELKAMWAFGYDIYLSLANVGETSRALSELELVIVQDLFLNETAKAFGSVFLPAASFFERDGTFMNSDRRVQRIRQVVPAPGEARPDWWIIQQLAARLGRSEGFDFAGPQAIWDEVRALWPEGAGLSYARLEHESLHWPCPDEQHPGTPVLYQSSFPVGQRAMLAAIAYLPTPEQTDADYPLLLLTGRTLYQFNAGTMSNRTPDTVLRPADTLDMAPADASRLGLADAAPVRVTSRYGEVVLPLRISRQVQPGQVFATFHRSEPLVNRLTSSIRDLQVQAPEYKVTAVRVTAASA